MMTKKVGAKKKYKGDLEQLNLGKVPKKAIPRIKKLVKEMKKEYLIESPKSKQLS